MTDKKDEALKLALEALEVATTPLAKDRQEVLRAITAIREALADHIGDANKMVEQSTCKQALQVEQPAQQQEPFCYHDGRDIVGKEYADHSDVFPLYTAPKPRQWVGLTQQDMKLALKTLEKMGRVMKQSPDTEKAIVAIRKALAEQPAQQQEPVARSKAYDMIDRFLQNNLNSDEDYAEYSKALDSIYTSPQPAQQQEPVYFCDYGYEGWGKVDAAMAAANLADGMTVEAYYTSPQLSKPWVGLTDEEIGRALDAAKVPELPGGYESVELDIARAIEAKLKEKNAQPSKPLTDEQRKAIVVCFTSGKVSVSEVQRKLAISYNEAQQLCQSIVDLGLAQGLQLAPSLDRHGIKGDA